MHRKMVALLGALLVLPATAWAQDRGTEAEQQACTPDVFRLCSDYIPDETPILACLKAKHAQLSTACEPVIFPHAATADIVHKPRHKRRRALASRPDAVG